MPTRDRAIGLAALATAAAPAAALFLNWHGFVPPGGDPSSCGLCAHGQAGGSSLEFPSTELALATAGIYGAILFGLEDARKLVDRQVAIAAAIGALLLLAFPASPGAHPAGVIWNLAGKLPSVAGSSLLFWVLVPVACAVLWVRLKSAPRRTLAVVFLGCFLISTLAIRYPWQKYVDPFALLALLFTVRKGELSSPRALAGAAILSLAFVAYTLDFSAHRDTRAVAQPIPSGGPIVAASGPSRST
jgi:hypothetical protein